MPSEIRKIEKNRFRKATATGSAFSCAGTYCLALKVYRCHPDYQKSGNGASAIFNFFLAAPGDFNYSTTAPVWCATLIHLNGFLIRVPPQAECNRLTSSGSTPALNHRALQQIDHSKAHDLGATIVGLGPHIILTYQGKWLKTKDGWMTRSPLFPAPWTLRRLCENPKPAP